MKVGRKTSALALALLISSFGSINVVAAQELNTLAIEDCSEDLISESIEKGQSVIDALINSIELHPECTKTFVDFAVGNNNSAAVRLTLAAISARPELLTDIVVAAIQALPDQKYAILGAVLDDIDDLSARIDLIYAVDDALQTTDGETIAELEEVDDEPEEVAELEESPAPVLAPPVFNPGASDKPSSISPT